MAQIQVNLEVTSNSSTIHTVPAAGSQNKLFPKKQLQVKKCIFYYVTKYQCVVTIDYKITPCRGIRIPESVKFFLWNPESWALESRMQLKESGMLLRIKIQNPLEKTAINCLESEIHGVQS